MKMRPLFPENALPHRTAPHRTAPHRTAPHRTARKHKHTDKHTHKHTRTNTHTHTHTHGDAHAPTHAHTVCVMRTRAHTHSTHAHSTHALQSAKNRMSECAPRIFKISTQRLFLGDVYYTFFFFTMDERSWIADVRRGS